MAKKNSLAGHELSDKREGLLSERIAKTFTRSGLIKFSIVRLKTANVGYSLRIKLPHPEMFSSNTKQ